MNVDAMELHARFQRRRNGLYVVLVIGAVVSFGALFAAAATILGGPLETLRTIRDNPNPTPEQLHSSMFGWSKWTLIGCLLATFGVATVVVSLLRLNRLARDQRAFAAESEDVAATTSA